MTRSVFYNLASPEGRAGGRAAARARPPRRAPRGLARRRPRRALRSGRRLAQPRPGVHDRAGRRRGERDGAAVVRRPSTYRSDSNQHWRHGCPHAELARGAFEWLQLLTHPEIWVYDGRHDGRDDARRCSTPSATRARRAARARTGSTSREADHGPRLRVGRARHRRAAPRAARERRARGAPRRHGHVRALRRAAPLRRVPPRAGRVGPRLRGRDARGRRARGTSTPSCRSRRSTCRASRRHASASPCRVLVSPPEAIRRSNDKAETYAILHRLGVPAPDFRRVRGAAAVEAAARELGYPDRAVCFKPVFSSGSRGFRILDPTVDRARPAPARAARARWRCSSRKRSSCCRPRTDRSCS